LEYPSIKSVKVAGGVAVTEVIWTLSNVGASWGTVSTSGEALEGDTLTPPLMVNAADKVMFSATVPV
jgi:hypothetical protein